MVEFLGYDPATMEADTWTLWRKTFPAKFHVSRDTFRAHTVGDPNFEPLCAYVAKKDSSIIGFSMGKRWLTPYSETGSIPENPIQEEIRNLAAGIAVIFVDPAHQRCGFGKQLLALVEKSLQQRGIEAVSLGREPGNHFTPGIPRELLESVKFFEKMGYRGRVGAIDLLGDLSDLEMSENMRQKETLLNEQDIHVSSYSPDFHDSLLEFLRSTFPGRWHKKALYYIEQRSPLHKPNPLDDLMIVANSKRDVVGFAMTWTQPCVFQAPAPLVLSDGRPDWGGLGPIGVHPDMRGKGLGLVLLARSLLSLKNKGIKNCVIDWTGKNLADNYYGKFGFQIFVEWLSMQKDLE